MRSGFVEVEGYSFHYYIEGTSGPKLVLLHGLSPFASAFSWKPLIESTKNDYQVLALDLIGHGKTSDPQEPLHLEQQAELIHKALTSIGFNEYSLIGFSWGAVISFRLASLYPNSVKSLVIADMAPEVHEEPKQVNQDLTVPYMFEDREKAIHYLEERVPDDTEWAFGSNSGEGYWRENLSLLLEEDSDDSWNTISHPSRHTNLFHDGDGWKYFEKIVCPTLLFRGSLSPYATDEKVERMKEIMDGLRVVTVEGAGHIVPLTHREEFEKAVRDYIPT